MASCVACARPLEAAEEPAEEDGEAHRGEGDERAAHEHLALRRHVADEGPGRGGGEGDGPEAHDRVEGKTGARGLGVRVGGRLARGAGRAIGRPAEGAVHPGRRGGNGNAGEGVRRGAPAVGRSRPRARAGWGRFSSAAGSTRPGP